MQSAAPPALDPTGDGSITLAVAGSSGKGPGFGGQPCLGNGQFAPPYAWDSEAGFLAFAVSPWEWDPSSIHCYPASFAAPTTEQAVSCNPTANADVNDYSWAHPGQHVNETDSALGCCAACNAEPKCNAWLTTKDGKPDQSGNNCWTFSCVGSTHPAANRIFGGKISSGQHCHGPSPPSPPVHSGWWGKGVSMDWYIAPAKHGYDFTSALYDLTGTPAVPPRHGMAFMATYWGYKAMAEVEGYMHRFRNGSYPIDSFIMDYDWFGPDSCAPKTDPDAQGGLNCGDFGYRASFWANQTFTKLDGAKVFAATPADVLAHFHDNLKMRFAGIRKPRSYSNVALSNASGWLMEAKSSVGAGGNNWNYSRADMREWYAKGHHHFLADGIDYWWNDEGETQWFTYLYWNMAQQAQWDVIRPNMRHFTINRAFQPGMQRFPAVTWSGDGQDCSHAMIIRFTLYGQPYTACDMTSPDATVLVRQYQNAVFMPIMRVHQMHGTPRFPFLWGGPEHQVAFRDALDMRYRFLPFLYSLAWAAHRHHKPIGHPASFEFPEWPLGETTYMVGGGVAARRCKHCTWRRPPRPRREQHCR